MLRLFAGRENIDKERFIYDRIRACAGETFVLVPDQYTLVAEEQAMKYMRTDCLFDVEITSMNRLGLRVLTEQGTESVRMLDKYGRFMLLTLLIREHSDDFEIFGRSAGKAGFTAMLSDFISEFKQQDCSIEKLQEMLSDTDGDPMLEAKLKELSGVITAYEEAIAGRYTDTEDYISMYISAIRDSALVRGKNIWIYGYDNITPKFAGAVIELASVAESVGFIVNRTDFGLDERLTASLERLASERGIDCSCEEIGGEYKLKKTETVSRIERSMWKDVLSRKEREENRDFLPEDLTLVCAANPYYEAETAAAYIWHLVRDLGYRMRDIQVIANDEGSMQPVIRRVFAEYGLPVFADASRDITDSAAVCFITNLLDFVARRKSSRFLFPMLKTGLAGIDDGDIEDLENYVRDYRIIGSMWDRPFLYGREDLGDETFDRLEALRGRISASSDGLKEIAAGRSVSEFIKSFRQYLDSEWDLTARVEEEAGAREEAGLHDEAQRLTQSYVRALELLDQIDEIMGSSEMDLAEFTEIYKVGLSDAEVGIIPPTADGLSMGTMIRTRPRQMRAAVILGACEGVLPLSPSTEGLFSVDEKKYFKKKGFTLGSLDEIKMDEENAAMYRMMARPSEKIYISYAMTDADGNDMSPSPVIDSLRRLFPRIDADRLMKKDIISTAGSDSLSPGEVSVINRADDGMRHLVKRVKSAASAEERGALSEAMLRWYYDNRGEYLSTMMKAAAYDNVQRPLDRDTARKLFARSDGSLVMSASLIGSFIDCPFRFFVEKGLKPKEERSFESDARSVGDIYHECLMAVARQIMNAEEIPGDEGLEELVTAALDELAERYRGGLFISTGGEEYRMSRIREICAAAAKAMAEQLSAESVSGAMFEEKFGRKGSFEPIRLRIGDEEVYVEGKIDRADILNVGGEERVRIIDYKTGSDKLDIWRMRQGYKMQLMIYLISAASGGLTPAGMFYFNIKDPIESANDVSAAKAEEIAEKEAADRFNLKGAYLNEEGVLKAMPEKVLDSSKNSISREDYEEIKSDVLARIEETASGILSGAITIRPLKNGSQLACRYCSYRSVCRRDRGYVKNAPRVIKTKPKKEKAEDNAN